MAEIPYFLNDPGAEEYFKTEIDTLPLAEAVTDRLALVAGNLALNAPSISLEYGYLINNSKVLGGRISGLDSTVRTLREEAEIAQESLLASPLRHTLTGLYRMRMLLNNYTTFAPAIFRGYAPVSTDSAWSTRLREDAVKFFSRREERLILLAHTMASEGSYDCGTYTELCAAGLRRGVIQVPKANGY